MNTSPKSPLTGSAQVRDLRTLNALDVSARWEEELEIDVGHEFRRVGKIVEHVCLETGLIFFSPCEAAARAPVYEQLQQKPWYYVDSKWEFEEALRLLKAETTILEIGGGTGAFLRQAERAGHQVVAHEVNPDARAKLIEAGFHLLDSDFDSAVPHTDKRSYDAVCAFQVLEHVEDVGMFLASCLRHLKPGGQLILSVPNNGVMTKVDRSNSDLLNHPPHHMSKWDANVFSKLPGIFPLTIEALKYEPLSHVHAKPFIFSFLKTKPVVPLKYLSKIARVLAKLLVGLRLNSFFRGHTLLVVFRKDPGHIRTPIVANPEQATRQSPLIFDYPEGNS